MAAMEKITYPPLIKHLSERSDFYNQLYREFEMNFGAIDYSIISSWMVNTIEPIIKEITDSNPDQLPQVFKAFFTELLQILGNRSGITNETEYRAAWKLCNKIPALFAIHPSRLLKAIDSAVESLRIYQPEKVMRWISLMEETADNIKTLEEFLACGRIYAWLCGMAHLRTRAKTEFPNLRIGLKQTILTINPVLDGLDTAFRTEWPNLKRPEFIGEIGGFVGFGGPFVAPPLVAQLENEILTTDKKSSCAFFADHYGKVLLSEVPVSPEKIIQESGIKDLNAYKKQYGEKLFPFDDITSFAVKSSTLVITRSSSHYLFVYGRPSE